MLGFVFCRTRLNPEEVIENTNQFEPGLEVFTHVTHKDLKELHHSLTRIHLVEFETDTVKDVLLVPRFRVLRVYGTYSKKETKSLASMLNSLLELKNAAFKAASTRKK